MISIENNHLVLGAVWCARNNPNMSDTVEVVGLDGHLVTIKHNYSSLVETLQVDDFISSYKWCLGPGTVGIAGDNKQENVQ